MNITQSSKTLLNQRQSQLMKSAVITAPRTVSLKTVDLPEPGPGEVRIRLKGCGLCASSGPVWEGRSWFDYPREPGEPGHEGWGVIDKIGNEVVGLKPGDAVAALSYHAFAEFDTAPADAVVKLPHNLRNQIVPGEPLGCAMNVFKRSDIRDGQTVAVIGAGFIGCLLIQLAKQAGARVIAISRRACSLKMAERSRADLILRLDDEQKIIREIQSYTGNRLCERVIEATGLQEPLELAGELCAVRGRLVIAGYHQDGYRQVNMQLWNWRGLDVINAHERQPAQYVEGMREAVRAVAEGILKPDPLYTHKLTLPELNSAFRLLEERPEGFMKAVICYE